MLSGCTMPGTQEKTSRDDNEVMEGFKENVAAKANDETAPDGQKDDFSTEVRHWKYNQPAASNPASTAQPYSSGTHDTGIDDGTVVSMQFVTAQDLDRIQAVLIQQGYLKAETHDEKEFKEAVAQFQEAHQLSPTGELDSRTITCFNQKGLDTPNKTQ